METHTYVPSKNVRVSDPATSRAAAASLNNVPMVQRRVLAIHADHPAGLTDEELLEEYIAVYGATAESSPRKRRHDLAAQGYIIDIGERRRLMSGRIGIVWGLMPGRAAAIRRATT